MLGGLHAAGSRERDRMKQLRPNTAREGLLQIRLELAQPILDSETAQRIDRLCREGLDRTDWSNFELTDLLADRFAKAYWLLERMKRADLGPISEGLDLCVSGGLDLHGEIAEALVLPPDLEAMMDRRRPR